MSDQQLALLDGALSIQKLIDFRGLIERAMAQAMKEGLHYGKVEGCGPKPTLLQPGAQLLCTLFRMRPEYEVTEESLSMDHKRFSVKCRLFLMGENPVEVGQGVGEASSKESKHRFRNAAAIVEDTGEPVPPLFWNKKKEEGPEAAKKWLSEAFDGQPVSVKKYGDEGWRVVIVRGGGDEKVENPNPADVWNTVLKMAKKRAFVDATITATSSNDFFTQDLEDIQDNVESVRAQMAAESTAAKSKPAEKTSPARKQGETGAESKPHEGHWKTVVCHIGKTDGPIKGKQLGAIEDGQRAWILKTLSEKEESRRSAQDKKVIAALLIWQQEHNSNASKNRRQKTAATKEEGNEGVNRSALGENLEWVNCPVGVFLELANREGWTKAAAFGDIADDEAAEIVSRWDSVLAKIEQEIEEREALGVNNDAGRR